MRICFLGLDNLPVLAPEFPGRTIGGESVQQALLATALARRGHAVSTVVADCGQADGLVRDGVRIWKAYASAAGWPVLRFVHPRWTRLWAALERADAEVYYTSCAGMQVGLLALFCRRRRRGLVYRVASDAECSEPQRLIRFARDRKLYEFGRRRAHVVLVQSMQQAQMLRHEAGLHGIVAGMLVAPPEPPAAPPDIDVLWVGNIQQLKRPDRILAVARALPERVVHLVGGPIFGEEQLYESVRNAARDLPNVTFHGPLAYREANALYGRSRLLVNTSDVEGFPNSYLQAWARGVPVVAHLDPDGVIAREGLGTAVPDAARFPAAVGAALADAAMLEATGLRCSAYLQRNYGEDRVLAVYLQALEAARAQAALRPAGGLHREAPHA